MITKNTSRRICSTALGCSAGFGAGCSATGAGCSTTGSGCLTGSCGTRLRWVLPRFIFRPAITLKYQSGWPASFELYLSEVTLALPSMPSDTASARRKSMPMPARPTGSTCVPSQR